MASLASPSWYSSCCQCYSNSVSATRFSSLSFSRSISTSNPLLNNTNNWFLPAKFDKFHGDSSQDILQHSQPQLLEEDSEDDSCLPSDLEGAVRQSGQASAAFVSSGGTRAIVELLIPQLQFLDDEGAQAELWELSRVFLDTLIEESGCQKVRAVFPDAGASALLQYRWKDAAFGFSSLSDRKPVAKDDEIVVMIVPDYQMLGYVENIASELSDDPLRPLVMWNPHLVSEDVGVGYNVRKLRRYFLSTFTTVYSMRPLAAGAVFRCYPGLWKVFYDDKDRPNRYLLAKELISRPTADELEVIYGDVKETSEQQGPSLFDKAAGIFSSFNRFMRVRRLPKDVEQDEACVQGERQWGSWSPVMFSTINCLVMFIMNFECKPNG